MPSCSQDIICLGDFCTCDDLVLPIAYSGNSLTMVAEFNGVKLRYALDTSNMNTITIPNIFNEYYTSIIYFIQPNGTILGGLYYSLRVIKCIDIDPVIPNNPLVYPYSSLTVSGMSGATVTDSRLYKKVVTALIINDMSRNKGFIKNLNDNFVTFTDGTYLNTQDEITIIFQL